MISLGYILPCKAKPQSNIELEAESYLDDEYYKVHSPKQNPSLYSKNKQIAWKWTD